MLDQQQLKEWARKLNLSEHAESAIYQIRSSPPARRVGGGAGNVCGRYPSRKMGVDQAHRAGFSR
jgi:putative transposase